MTSPRRRSNSESPKNVRIDLSNAMDAHRTLARRDSSDSTPATLLAAPRLSPTLTRSFDPHDLDAQERQRAMDVDSAMQLSRARSGDVAIVSSPREGLSIDDIYASSTPGLGRHPPNDDSDFPMSFAEHEDMLLARGEYPQDVEEHGELMPTENGDPTSNRSGGMEDRDAARLAIDLGLVRNMHMAIDEPAIRRPSPVPAMGGLPGYQPTQFKSHFDLGQMEEFAAAEKERLGLTAARSPAQGPIGSGSTGAELRRRLAQAASARPGDGASLQPLNGAAPEYQSYAPSSTSPEYDAPSSPSGVTSFAKRRHRKLSQSNSAPRRQGKLALFEGNSGPPPFSLMPSTLHQAAGGSDAYNPTFSGQTPGAGSSTNVASGVHLNSMNQPSGIMQSGHDRPYRFSFYSNALQHTIHSRSLSELPAEGQTFEDLFYGPGDSDPTRSTSRMSSKLPTSGGYATPATGTDDLGMKSSGKDSPFANARLNAVPAGPRRLRSDAEIDVSTWWLDVTCPTDDEMRLLSKVFGIHPLTTEDILMEETREKIELFRNYYFVCFRSFDQDIYSPTHLEPLNMYIIVFREGTLSFHFRGTPHPQSVRRRIKQLKDYINVTSDWISYALIDDITDAFGPLIQSIEYEVDSIDELVLILKETEQSDMLRRIGTCRKKVMGLLRLMGNKADVVKGLAKRCNENWTVAPKSDIGLYLSDIQDHLITMTQNLNHYEKILSRSHSNYLAQISIEMTDANNQINDVLSKLTALGTVLIPMNLVTGLWGMNVHVPGQDIQEGYTWFISIIGALTAFAVLGGFLTYKLLRSS